MDKETAKFILQSFRPDGADAADSDFQEALQLAARDRELGEWLAQERAADATFAEALNSLQIPDELRINILAVMHGINLNEEESNDIFYKILSDALSHVKPPEGLRDKILAAMYMEESQNKKNVIPISSKKENKWTFPRLIGMAAAIALGCFLAFQINLSADTPSKLPSYLVQQQVGHLLNEGFDNDMKNIPKAELNTWLVSHHLPAPENLPAGLKEMKVLGCKQFDIGNGQEAAIVCFLKPSKDMLHLVIIKNEDIKDTDLPSMSEVNLQDCYHCSVTEWNVVRWRDRENTFILLAKKENTPKAEFIQYF